MSDPIGGQTIFVERDGITHFATFEERDGMVFLETPYGSAFGQAHGDPVAEARQLLVRILISWEQRAK
jgi:hypothetical protein